MTGIGTVGILGGTGPAGRGLASRLSAAGVEVVIGSRSRERAEETVAELRPVVGEAAPLRAGDNATAAGSSIVVVATPWEGALETTRELAEALTDKVLVSMVNALTRSGREFHALVPARGSLAATLQAELPRSKVSAAFQHLPARELGDLSRELRADVLVCADDRSAAETTVALVDAMPGLRGVRAGSLASAGAIESLTAVLLNVNRNYRTHVTLRLGGLPNEG